MNFLANANFDFMTRRGIAAAVSLLVIAIGVGSLVMHKGPRYSIDFTGGSLLQMRFADPVSISEVRDALAAVNQGDAGIQQYGGPTEMLVRIKDTGDASAVPAVKETLRERWPDLDLRREETVGPKIGGELRSAAFQVILWALVGILIYVTIRFEFRFAVAAIIALIHDVLITLGAFSLSNREISLAVIAAFLTIVGYSLNDTIVVFDRIRENLRVPTREQYLLILNRSINQSLSRTIITSGTTLLVTLVLFFFGGEVLKDFAFALTVGVLVGTYSSIFVASPILVEWEKHRPRKVK